MNKFIQSTKQFFNKKPVRIVTALLVIAIIMTGVVFGVIALVKALSDPDPCAKQPGTTWDKNLKVCVKNSCQMDNGEDGFVCKNQKTRGINTCIPKDYCDYNGPEGQYSYDEESCMCKLDCSSLGEEYQGFTKDGLQNEINMQKLGDKYIPVGDGLICGLPCDISNKKFCNVGDLCAKSINYNKQTKTKEQYLPGECLPSNFVLCNKDKNIACSSQDDCITDDEGNVVCKFKYCGDGDDKVIACTSDSDCGTGSEFIGSCSNIIKAKNGSSKRFKNVKYCTKTDKSSINAFCLNIDNIGENSEGQVVSDCSLKEGVSDANPQCPHSQNPPGCAINGLCDNGWQAIPNGGKQQCLPKNKPIPTSLSEGDCCDGNHTAVDPFGNKFCCIKDTTKNHSCLNKTKKPYSAKLLKNPPGSDLTTKIKCPNSNELNILNKTLWNKLGLTDKDKPNDPNSINYTGLYCGKSEDGEDSGYLYAFCGHDNSDIEFTTFNGHTTSFCKKKDNKCKFTGESWTDGTLDLNGMTIPYCKKDTSSPEKYWNIEANTTTDTGFSTSYNMSSDSCPNINMETCASTNIASIHGYITDVDVTDDNKCKFTVNCDEYTVSAPPKSGKSIPLKWNQINKASTYNNNPNIDYNKMFKTKKISQKNPSGDPDKHCTGDNLEFPNGITESVYTLESGPAGDSCVYNDKIDNLLSWDGVYCEGSKLNKSSGSCN
jgi:hypothetical protein